MSGLTETLLLEFWDGRDAATYHERAMQLLRLGQPDSNVDSWWDRSVGQRNSALLETRRRIFGDQLNGIEPCPACHESIECSVPIGALLRDQPAEPAERVTVSLHNATIELHPPTSRDIDEVIRSDTSDDPRQMLLLRCQERNGGASDNPLRALSPAGIEEVEQALLWGDPLADINLSLECEGCGHEWNTPLDIVNYLWEECMLAANRLLMQVHLLASAYHWTESSILQLSEKRRQFYLDCIDT